MDSANFRVHDCFINSLCQEKCCSTERVEASRDLPRTPYPVLAVLAPVITSPDNELAYPGDPMCLYSALALTVSRPPPAFGPHPDWGVPPAKAYRLASPDDGIRKFDPDAELCSDQVIFDPRVWTANTEESFRSELRVRQPRVLLISSVSAAHRHALQMAAIAKQEIDDCVVVFGGRHIDETIRQHPGRLGVTYAHSSTVRVITDGRAQPVVDFLVSGDGAFALDLLMLAISQSMNEHCVPDVRKTISALHRAGLRSERPPGRAVIVALLGDEVHAFPIQGAPYDLADLPAPYEAFTIRSRFPIFPGPGPGGRGRRTAHLMTSVSCPYRCSFCSESVQITGSLRRFDAGHVEPALARVCQYLHYGAEAIFVDDPVFWAGNFPAILRFCKMLADARATRGAGLPTSCVGWLRDPDDVERLVALEWGMQLTVDLLTTVHQRPLVEETLTWARRAGCSYVYLGLESMATEVMAGIHKNLHQQQGPSWREKVRQALTLIKSAGIRTGTSVLFGLDGETRQTIEQTVEEVGLLLDDGLLDLASPNILTYHPATPVTARHGMADRIDYQSSRQVNRPPYVFFEEAYPDVVTRLLTESDVWRIHELTQERWGNGRHRHVEALEAAQ